MKIYPSSLGLQCPRNLWHLYRKSKKEILPTIEMEAGIELEKVLTDAIKNKQTHYQIEDRMIQIPQLLLTPGAQFQFPIKYEIENFQVSGRCDFIVPNVTVDFKQRYSLEITKNDEWQCLGYIYPQLIDSEKEQKTYVFFLRWGVLKEIGTYDVFSADKVKAKLLKEFQRIADIVNCEKCPDGAGNWLCYYCPFIVSCEAVPNVIKTINENPQSVAQELVRIDAQFEALKKAIKGYIAKSGNIKIEDGEIGYFATEKTIIDNRRLLQAIQKRKLDILNFYNPAITKIKSMSKSLGWLTSFVNIEVGNPKFDIKVSKPKQVEGEE